jgi:hypothetical protein
MLEAPVLMAKRMWTTSVVLLVSATCLVAAIVIFAWLHRFSVRYDPVWRYVEEIVTGNWSPDQPSISDGGISDRSYLVGLLLALVINYGPYVVLFAALKALVEGKKVMNLMMAMSVRDEVAKSSLTKLLSQSMSPDQAKKVIETAYDTADATWQRRLGSMIGENGLSRVMQELKENKFPESGES